MTILTMMMSILFVDEKGCFITLTLLAFIGIIVERSCTHGASCVKSLPPRIIHIKSFAIAFKYITFLLFFKWQKCVGIEMGGVGMW